MFPLESVVRDGLGIQKSLFFLTTVTSALLSRELYLIRVEQWEGEEETRSLKVYANESL